MENKAVAYGKYYECLEEKYCQSKSFKSFEDACGYMEKTFNKKPDKTWENHSDGRGAAWIFTSKEIEEYMDSQGEQKELISKLFEYYNGYCEHYDIVVMEINH